MTSDDAKKICDRYVANDPNFDWGFVEVRYIDAKDAHALSLGASKWVVKYAAPQEPWSQATKLIIVDDVTGECVDWGC